MNPTRKKRKARRKYRMVTMAFLKIAGYWDATETKHPKAYNHFGAIIKRIKLPVEGGR